MRQSYVLAAVLFVLTILAVLGALGKLPGPMQRCMDSGKVWVPGKGRKCHERNIEVGQNLRDSHWLRGANTLKGNWA